MKVDYGADYSAHELSPTDLDQFTQYDLRFLIRYIGWPDNPKCISHYPGAYQKLVESGRTVLLVAEFDGMDPAGGYHGGVAMAQRALGDAHSVGYPDNLPIFFCADGWLAANGISVATAMSYLAGAASVAGPKRTGAYGFRDFIQGALADHQAQWLWLCGSAPIQSEVAQGWPHFYQWNGGTIYPGGMAADLDWAYPGVLDAVRAGGPPPSHFPAGPPQPGTPGWPLPAGGYFGQIIGPPAAHNGLTPADHGWVKEIQQALIRKGFVPGVTDPQAAWADGVYGDLTYQAVLRFQHAQGLAQTGHVGPDDWDRLLS
jgi:Putative peptidoglycan binding domain/Domain of unknown function (DUF1906)